MNLPEPNGLIGIDWERYRAFLAVLAGGSLSAASRDLRVMQPTVRRRIEELEREIGAALFVRSPTGLTPTPLALELRGPARAMAASAEAFARAASAEAGAPSGVVRVTASEVVGVEVLPPMLAAIRAVHPGLTIALGSDNRTQDLLHHEADIAIRMVRPRQEALVARWVGGIALGLFAHRRVVDAWGVPASLADLVRFPLIGFETETPGVRALRARGLSLRAEDFVFRTDSDLGQLAAIRAGMGFGVCQVALARRDPDFVRVLGDAFVHDLDTWVVMHEDQRAVRRVRLVFDALADQLSDYANTRSGTNA